VALGAPASALTPSPGWEVTQAAYPTNLLPGGEGELELDIYNTGSLASNGAFTVRDALPHGVTLTHAEFIRVYAGEEVACSGGTVVVCTISSVVNQGEMVKLMLKVGVEASSSGAAINAVTVAGGGATGPASSSLQIAFGAPPAHLGFASVDAWFTNADGTTATQAGSHPYEFTTDFNLNAEPPRGGELGPAGGEEARNVEFQVPPGVIGDPNAVAQCPRQQLDISFFGVETCPAASQVGVERFNIGGVLYTVPLYNMVPPPGSPAQFAFSVAGFNVFLDASVRTGGDYGITTHVNNIPQLGLVSNSVTLWGVPSDPSHDFQRGECLEHNIEERIPFGEPLQLCPSGAALTPFLTLPTSCGSAPLFAISGSAWQNAGVLPEASTLMHETAGAPTGITGCDRLGFAPSISVAPDTGRGDTPAGLTTDVKIPQEGLTASTYRLTGSAESLAPADLQNATVTLPEGLVLNPGQAAGLAACQTAESGIGTEGPSNCPSASKVGIVQVTTPLLPDKLEGNVYLLQSQPPNIKLLIAASGDGVYLKVPGDVTLDEATGRLTARFPDAPPLPFSDFKLSFSGGAQAALVTPALCGTYTTAADFQPWSSPFAADAFTSSGFAIESGPGGSACAAPLPFTPTMSAGATTDQAGGYTDFTMLLSREDGQQRISRLQFKTPKGLLGMISRVTLCEEPQAARGECPANAQIGHTVVGAGPGPYPLFVPETGRPPAPIYITGPYQGAPYGLTIVVPIIAGPFNLGNVVVRAKIDVDPRTSQLTITTDPLPVVLDGVPADLRAIDAVIDRPGFMFNPTNCEPQAFSGTAFSNQGATAVLSSHFQMGSCRALTFKPNFKVSTSAHASRANGASLDAKILYPTGELGANQASSQANVARVKVELPKQLPSRLTTLQKACTAAVFNANPANCPAGSLVGHAIAITPVLPSPVSGPVYFVSHGGEAFPSLIIVLQGDGITVDLEGSTFISKQGITSSTFKTVPDVPITSFELTFPQGPYSALAANGNLCRANLKMPTEFVGQNGARLNQSTRIAVTGCPKGKHGARHRKSKAVRRKARSRGAHAGTGKAGGARKSGS
jgi:hypothetical protein